MKCNNQCINVFLPFASWMIGVKKNLFSMPVIPYLVV